MLLYTHYKQNVKVKKIFDFFTDITISLIIALPAVYLFNMMLRWSLTLFPKTYTIGEAMIVTQAAVLFLVLFLVKTINFADNSDKEMDFITVIIFVSGNYFNIFYD